MGVIVPEEEEADSVQFSVWLFSFTFLFSAVSPGYILASGPWLLL